MAEMLGRFSDHGDHGWTSVFVRAHDVSHDAKKDDEKAVAVYKKSERKLRGRELANYSGKCVKYRNDGYCRVTDSNPYDYLYSKDSCENTIGISCSIWDGNSEDYDSDDYCNPSENVIRLENGIKTYAVVYDPSGANQLVDAVDALFKSDR